MEALTAAHPTLPMPSLARVTNLQNSAPWCRVNDRGPYARGRAIDCPGPSPRFCRSGSPGPRLSGSNILGPAPGSAAITAMSGKRLAQQPWAGSARGLRRLSGQSPAPSAFRDAPTPAYGDRRPRTSAGPAAPVVSQAAVAAEFNIWPPEDIAADQPGQDGSSVPKDERQDAGRLGPRPQPPQAAGSAGAMPPPINAANPGSTRQDTAPRGAKPHRQRPAFIEAGLFPNQRLAERARIDPGRSGTGRRRTGNHRRGDLAPPSRRAVCQSDGGRGGPSCGCAPPG